MFNIKFNQIINTGIKTTLVSSLALVLVACSSQEIPEIQTTDNTGRVETEQNTGNGEINPESNSSKIVIQHAFGETVIEEKPERIATVGWGNHDVPLALGIAPVGITRSDYGVQDGSGILPWTAGSLDELGADTPALFTETDGIDFEAVNDVQPDVILAAYSGMTADEFAILSELAPVVAYPVNPWQTLWREMTLINSKGMGMQEEGEQLVKDLEALIEEKVSNYPNIAGKSFVFAYVTPTNLSTMSIYVISDPRVAYLVDLGLVIPESILALSEESGNFFIDVSAENIDILSDVDMVFMYGTQELIDVMQADALLSTMPAIRNGAIVMLEDGTPLAASCTPTPLSIPWTIDEYLALISEAAGKVE